MRGAAYTLALAGGTVASTMSPTETGERLLTSLECHFDGIEAGLSALNEMRDKPAGTIRITTHDHAASTILWPRLKEVLFAYPEIKVEININYGLIDIVEQRFDAGVRIGDQVAKDMIAVRISPDIRMAVVASPSYFGSRPIPTLPRDLTGHNCVNLRLPTHNAFYAWEFFKDGENVQVQVDGQCSFNTTPQILQAALDGTGWPMCRKIWSSNIPPPVACSASSTTGARRSPAIIFIIPAVGCRRPRSRLSSMPCASDQCPLRVLGRVRDLRTARTVGLAHASVGADPDCHCRRGPRAAAGGPVQEMRPGDVIRTPPGVKHSHGAAPSKSVSHITIQESLNGKNVEWLDKVGDEQYGK